MTYFLIAICFTLLYAVLLFSVEHGFPYWARTRVPLISGDTLDGQHDSLTEVITFLKEAHDTQLQYTETRNVSRENIRRCQKGEITPFMLRATVACLMKMGHDVGHMYHDLTGVAEYTSLYFSDPISSELLTESLSQYIIDLISYSQPSDHFDRRTRAVEGVDKVAGIPFSELIWEEGSDTKPQSFEEVLGLEGMSYESFRKEVLSHKKAHAERYEILRSLLDGTPLPEGPKFEILPPA